MTNPSYSRYGYVGAVHTCTHTNVVHAVMCGQCTRLERELLTPETQKEPTTSKKTQGIADVSRNQQAKDNA